MNKRNIDNCQIKHAMAILDKVDAGQLGSFDGSYMYKTDPWFLEIIRTALKIMDERYNHNDG